MKNFIRLLLASFALALSLNITLAHADGAVLYCSPVTVPCQNLSARVDEAIGTAFRVKRLLDYMVAIKGVGNDYTKIAAAFGTPLAADQGAASGLALFNAVNQLNGYFTNVENVANAMDRFAQ